MAQKINLTYSLHTLNGISAVLAVVVMGLCLWLRYEWDFKHYVYELEAQKVFWTGPYILIASSTLALATVAIGIWATVVENCQLFLLTNVIRLSEKIKPFKADIGEPNGPNNPKQELTCQKVVETVKFVVGSVLSIVLGLAGLAYTLAHGIYKSDLTPWLEERFFVLFHEMDYNERSARIMRIIQEDIQCCGPSDWTDYLAVNKVLPDECRDPSTGNIAGGGCAEEFARWMEPKTGWLSGIALLLVVIQFGGISIGLWLRKVISQENRKNNKPYRLVSHGREVLN